LLTGDGDALGGLYFASCAHAPAQDGAWRKSAEPFSDVLRQLDEHFAGTRTRFDVPLRLDGTPFQRAVWSELGRIPYGATRSYAEIARRIGAPDAARAVGAANAKNPVSVVLPCHRVIGSDGALTGYAGGEARKRFLLELEARTMRQGAASARSIAARNASNGCAP
jgi:methylated-DNA-[protein]-cysteine S-methyltransferase